MATTTVDPPNYPVSGFSRVLQGQESSTLRGGLNESNELSNALEKPIKWPSPLEGEKLEYISAMQGHGMHSSSRPNSGYTDLLSGLGCQQQSIASSRGEYFYLRQTDQCSESPQQDGKKLGLSGGGSWSLLPPPSTLSLGLLDSSTNSPYQKIINGQGRWFMPPPPPSYYYQPSAPPLPPPPREVIIPRPIMSLEYESLKPKEGNFKLFGISLTSSPPAVTLEQPPQKNAKLVDHEIASSEQKRESNYQSKGKVQGGGSTRSCTKVHKQGIALGRSVDLTKFRNYEELLGELEEIFEFSEGELKGSEKIWLVVYTDDEGDMMLVGDDPWQEFCGMVKKIFIYRREEVLRMNPGTLSSKTTKSMEEEEEEEEDDSSSEVMKKMKKKVIRQHNSPSTSTN